MWLVEGDIFSLLFSPRSRRSTEEKRRRQTSLGLMRDVRDFREHGVCKGNVEGQGRFM